jgi:hypothetical protein
MQTTTKMILAICCIGAVAVETLAPVYAQHRHRTWNGCPRGWTVQGGNCAPYQWGGARTLGVVVGAVGGVAAGVATGIPLMDAHQVTRYRAETLHPTDGDGEAGRKATC